MKPKISIGFNNGVIGAVQPIDTGCFGLVASAVAVDSGFQLETPYQIKNLKDVATLKLTDSIDNHRLYKAITEFYAEAGEGMELWIYGMPKDKKVSEWFEPVEGIAPVEHLLNAAKGKIRGLFCVNDTTQPAQVENGMDADVLVATGKAHTLFKKYTGEKYAPFFTILEAYAFDGNKVSLPDLKTNDYNSVGILIGDTETRTGTTASKGSAVGVLAGRLAQYGVKVNPGKVKNGALSAQKLFINDTPVEQFDTEALYDKGFITFTTHQNRAGYFVMDANMVCAVDDDYHYITHRRTINEAFRHTYDALLDFLMDEIPANNDGTIQAIYAKTIESAVERKIATAMGADLNQNADNPRDTGVRCFVNPNQNIVKTSKIEVSVGIRPYGTARWIEVLLGFELEN